MPVNKRLFYACEQISVAPLGSSSFTAIHGAQRAGVNSNFNLTQAFEIGQINIYENVEGIPQVEITTEKVLDGHPLIYHLCTQGATAGTLAGRSNQRSHISLDYFPDTNDSATGRPVSELECSGVFVSQLGYTFSVGGFSTEQVSLVGNNHVWVTNNTFKVTGGFTSNADQPLAITGSGGVNDRRDFIWANPHTADRDANGAVGNLNSVSGTILPRVIYGISSSGTNDLVAGQYNVHAQSVSCSTNLGREEILELGRLGPYHRPTSFPVTVTTSIEVIATSGNMVSFTETGYYGSGCNLYNLTDETIKVLTCEGTRLNLGPNNKLTGISETGGDATGGNRTITYTFENQNFMVVQHPQDPTTALRP